METGTGMEMVDRKWEGNGNSIVWKKFPLVALIMVTNKLVGWLAEQFAISSQQSCVI